MQTRSDKVAVDIATLSLPTGFEMFSLDVTSRFTKVPVAEAIDLACEKVSELELIPPKCPHMPSLQC